MEVELTTIIALLMILMVAFMFAPLGLGGGVLFVPIFLYLLEWEIHLAIISSLSLVWMVSLGSRTAHSKDGFAVFEVGKKGAVAAVFGEIFGTFLSALFIMKLGDLPIKIIASLLLVWVIYYTVKKQLSEKTHAHSNEVEEIPVVEGRLLNIYRAGCFGAGSSSGLLGIGGGSVFVTIHRTTLGFKQHQAAGTSYIIESWMVPTGIIAHLLVDGSAPMVFDTVGFYFVPICMLVAGAAWLGARAAIKMVPQKILTYPFLIAVVAGLIRYLIDIHEILLVG